MFAMHEEQRKKPLTDGDEKKIEDRQIWKQVLLSSKTEDKQLWMKKYFSEIQYSLENTILTFLMYLVI